MASRTDASAPTHHGSMRKIRLWSDKQLVDWNLDVSVSLSEEEIKSLIAAQFNRSPGANSFLPMSLTLFYAIRTEILATTC